MSEWLKTLQGVVLFDRATYERFLNEPVVMRRGVVILLVCFLLAGTGQLAKSLIDGVRSPELTAAQQEQEFREAIETMRQFFPGDDPAAEEAIEQALENTQTGLAIATAIARLPTPLPHAASGIFSALGAWLTAAFAHLGSWLAYAIWVLLFAKISGGRGVVRNFLGLTALFAVPNLLGIFQPVPCLGAVLALVGMVWGWAVYVRAVQVSQGFSGGKAFLVTFLPALLLLTLAIVGVLLAVALIASSSSGV